MEEFEYFTKTEPPRQDHYILVEMSQKMKFNFSCEKRSDQRCEVEVSREALSVTQCGGA